MRENAGGSAGLSRAVCWQGFFSAATVLIARDMPVGVVEFGPLLKMGSSGYEAALELAAPLLRELEREAGALFDSTLHALPEPLRRAIAFIHAHLDKPMSLATVAGASSLSAGHFSRIFRACLGRPVPDFIASARVRRSCELLKVRPQARISEIAMESGFESIAHFNRQFRKFAGMAPGEFRSLAGRNSAEALEYAREHLGLDLALSVPSECYGRAFPPGDTGAAVAAGFGIE